MRGDFVRKAVVCESGCRAGDEFAGRVECVGRVGHVGALVVGGPVEGEE